MKYEAKEDEPQAVKKSVLSDGRQVEPSEHVAASDARRDPPIG